MTYREYRDKSQAGYNALPIFYAFSDKQFKEAMEVRGLTVEDTDKLYKLGGTGGFYLKKDAQMIRDYFEADHEELHRLMEDPVFTEDAFFSEMQNHEYHINWQADWDVCSCFGQCEYSEEKGGMSYLKEMGYGIETLQAYQRAKQKFYQLCDENGWF